MADAKLLLLQIRTIISCKSFTKIEIICKLDEIGTLVTKRVNFIKTVGSKYIVQDDFAALQLPKSEMARAPEDVMPARYCESSMYVFHFAAGPLRALVFSF